MQKVWAIHNPKGVFDNPTQGFGTLVIQKEQLTNLTQDFGPLVIQKEHLTNLTQGFGPSVIQKEYLTTPHKVLGHR